MQGTWSEEVWPDHGLLMLLLKEHILSLQPVPKVVAKPGSPPGLTLSHPFLTPPPLSHPWTWLSLSCLSFPAEVLVVNQGLQRTQREETTREATVHGLRLLSATESKNLSKTQVLGSTLETQIQEIFQVEVLNV